MGILDNTIDKTKGVFRSITAVSSILGVITPSVLKILEHAQQIDPILISDTQAFVITTISGALALWGRWRATKLIKGLF